MTARLYGFGPSVYTRSVRMAACALGVPFDWVPRDPFAGSGSGPVPEHPFDRVPVWEEDGVRLHETGAILEWLVARHGRPPEDALVRARIVQVAGIADAYAYWPLVRQVYAQGVLRPAEGLTADPEAVTAGLAAAPRVLDALDRIAGEGHVLNAAAVTRADWHLAPMLAAFVQCPDGAALLAARPALAAWYDWMTARPEFTEPEIAP